PQGQVLYIDPRWAQAVGARSEGMGADDSHSRAFPGAGPTAFVEGNYRARNWHENTTRMAGSSRWIAAKKSSRSRLVGRDAKPSRNAYRRQLGSRNDSTRCAKTRAPQIGRHRANERAVSRAPQPSGLGDACAGLELCSAHAAQK